MLTRSKLKQFLPLALQNIFIGIKYKTFKRVLLEEFDLATVRKKIKNSHNCPSKNARILFYPTVPSAGFFIYKICRLNGYRIITDPAKPADLVINWQRDVYAREDIVLSKLNNKHNVINYQCKDISKENVDRMFEAVFSYSAMVDPLKFDGNCVIKSNLNAKHDGRIVQCPISKKEDGVVYQRVVDNQYNKDFIYDIRVPVFKKIIPVVFMKLRSINDRFAHVKKSWPVQPQEAFSKDEIKNIILFSERIGLDYGDLDVLRDNNDRRLYIVDANPCPWNTPSDLPTDKRREVWMTLARTFDDEFIGKHS